MVNTKKIIASLAIFGILFSQAGVTFGYDDYSYYGYNSSVLYEKTQEINKFLNNFYSRLENKSTQEKLMVLKKIKVKLGVLEGKQKNSKNRDLLKYIGSQIGLEIESLETQKKYFESDLTTQEINNVENEVKKLQAVLFSGLKNGITSIKDDLIKATNYNEIGNSKTNLMFNKDGIGSANANLELSNYEIDQNFLDQRIKSNIKLNGEYNTISGSGDLNLETLGEMISKDGEIYVALKNLKLETSNKELKEIIDEYAEYFKDNKFVKLSGDENLKMFYQNLRGVSLNDALLPIEELSKKSLFTPYKKEGNKYYLLPSRDFCNEVANQSNSFMMKYFGTNNNESCTNYAYSKLVKEISKELDIYIEIGNDNKLVIEAKNEDAKFDVTYNSDLIKTLNFGASNKGESVKLEYINNNKLNLVIDVEDFYFDFISKIQNNEFTKIDSKLTITDRGYDLKGNFKLENGVFAGKYLSNIKKYDYSTGDYVDNGDFNFTISGNKTDLKYDFNLNSDYVVVKSNADFKNKSGKVSFVVNGDVNRDGNFVKVFDINGDVKYDKNYVDLDLVYDVNVNLGYGPTYAYKGDFEIEYDTSNNKNNANLLFNVIEKDSKIFEFKSVNTGLRSNPSKEIVSPTEFIDLKDMNTSYNLEAKDLSRINDLRALTSAIEQTYQDLGEYPTPENFFENVEVYLEYVPVDENDGETIDGCEFGYKYGVGPDNNGIENQIYTLSTCVESKKYKQRATQDLGVDDNRIEHGNSISTSKKMYFIEDLFNGYDY